MVRKIILASVLFGTLAVFGCGAQTENNKNNRKMKATIELTQDGFLTKVADYKNSPAEWKYLGDKPAIVDFYATWCGPCKMVAPILEELAGEYAGKVDIYKVDVDKERELASAFGIRSIPTFLFIPLEGEPQMVSGAMGKEDFRKRIDQLLK